MEQIAGAVKEYLIDLTITNVQFVYQVAMGGTAAVVVNLPGPAFTSLDSYRALCAPSAVVSGSLATGTGDGGLIDPNIVVRRISPNQVEVSTADGTVSSTLVDVVAFGS